MPSDRHADATTTRPSRPLRAILQARSLADATVVAGASGLDRLVERLNVMEVPDIRAWVKPRELLLTTGYPMRDRVDSLAVLIAELDDAGLAGIAIKPGRYLDDIPSAMLAEAEQRGFPVIRLGPEVAFDEIINDVLAGILHDQAAALLRSQRIQHTMLQLVLDGHGLPEIVRDLASIVQQPTMIVDVDGRVITTSDPDATHGLGEVLTMDDPSATALLNGQHLRADISPIMAGARTLGHLVVATDAPLDDDAQAAVRSAATVAAVALTKSLELRALEDKYRSDLVHDLLRGVEDPDDAYRRASGFGWDLHRRCIVIVLRVDPGPRHQPADTRMGPVIRSIEPLVTGQDSAAAVVRFTREIVVIMRAFSGVDGRDRARAFTASLAQRAAHSVGTSVSAGLSRPVESVEGIPRAYDQAVRALNVSRRFGGDGSVAHFDDLGVYRLLALVDDHAELEAFADEVLGELRSDEPSAVDLRHTLEVLLANGGNVAQAARELHFHYNTLRYRLDKLIRLLGPFTTDRRLRLNIELALLIDGMREPHHRASSDAS